MVREVEVGSECCLGIQAEEGGGVEGLLGSSWKAGVSEGRRVGGVEGEEMGEEKDKEEREVEGDTGAMVEGGEEKIRR